ncbi:MAG: ABC transporter permease, partial [Achromobacter sp.]
MATLTQRGAAANQPKPRNDGMLAILGSIPLALVFLTLVLTPLALTFALSFRPFDYATGIQPGHTFEHYLAVVTDGYFIEIFWRTFWIAGVTTLICVLIGAP